MPHGTMARWRTLAVRAVCLIAVAAALGGCGPCGSWWGKSQSCQSEPRPQ